MSSTNRDYQLLDPSEEELEKSTYSQLRHLRKDARVRAILFWGLLASVLLNILVCVKLYKTSKYQAEHSDVTKYAGLVWDTPGEFEHHGIFDSKNETLTEESWANLKYDLGSVAISDEEAAGWGLPKAQRFPWDDSKGLYFINGYHGIHCLKILHITLTELHTNQTLTFPYAHSSHCLEALLQDTLCFADDTPRFTSFDHPGSPGFGQPRKCRDWSKLEQFAKDHASCWRDIEPAEDIDTLLRYRYCPEGSPYNERIHAIFGDFDKDYQA